jgi:hypothetical protein
MAPLEDCAPGRHWPGAPGGMAPPPAGGGTRGGACTEGGRSLCRGRSLVSPGRPHPPQGGGTSACPTPLTGSRVRAPGPPGCSPRRTRAAAGASSRAPRGFAGEQGPAGTGMDGVTPATALCWAPQGWAAPPSWGLSRAHPRVLLWSLCAGPPSTPTWNLSSPSTSLCPSSQIHQATRSPRARHRALGACGQCHVRS